MNYSALVIITVKYFLGMIGIEILVQPAVIVVVQLLVFIIVVICVDVNGGNFFKHRSKNEN
jgi:hypothetical protein